MVETPELPAELAARLNEDPERQRGFRWSREKWLTVFDDVPDARSIINELPDLLDREVIREVVQGNLIHDRVIGAFLSTYIWGNPGGLGPSRARRIITGIHTRDNYLAPEIAYVRERLLTGALLVQKSGAVEGFRYMNNEGYIKYLRAAFFTKWLSYSSMVHSVDGEEVVPILDKRVRDWIEATTEGRENLSTTSTADYSRYVDILGAWGSESKRSRVQVELEIFRLTAK